MEKAAGFEEKLSFWKCFQEYLIILLAPFILLAPVIFTGKSLFWGTPSLQFVPWWWQAWEQVRQGLIPLWNPLNGMGAPLLANYQMAFFYPPNWILIPLAGLFGPAGIAWGYTLLSILHLSWAGLGMAFLLRRLRFISLAQQVGGLAFGLSGVIVGRLGFFSMVWVAAWIPWSLIAVEGLSQQRDRPFTIHVNLAICIAMQLLAGHAQFAWYSLLLAGVWLVMVVWRKDAWKQSFLRIAEFGAATILGVCVAMVQLLPTFQYLSQSQRADSVGYEEVMRYSFWPWRFITLFSPDFFGNPGQGNYWGYASFWEDHAYAGIIPLVLALATLILVVKGVLRKERRTEHWKLALFLWALIFVTLVLALGQNTPVFPFLYRRVPTFDMFQAPARYLIWLAAALPILSAYAVEYWRSPTGRGLYWFRLATAGAFAVTLGAGITWLTMKGIQLTFIRSTALTGIWALGFGLLTLAIPYVDKRGKRSAWNTIVVSWTTLDLIVAGYLLNPGVDLSFYRIQLDKFRDIDVQVGSGRVYLADRDEYELKFYRFMRFKDFRPLEDLYRIREVLLPNLNLLNGISTVNNFDPLVPGRFARWMSKLNEQSLEENRPWLALMNVSTIEQIDVRQQSGVRFDPIKGGEKWRWYDCIQPVDSEVHAWKALEENMIKFTSGKVPLIIENWTRSKTGNCQNNTNIQLKTLAERPDRVSVRVVSDHDGWLFSASTWYPGWIARLDNAKTPLYRANYLFQAVYVPSGEHTVELFYTPVEFYSGCLSSILGIFVLIVVLCKMRGSKHQQRIP